MRLLYNRIIVTCVAAFVGTASDHAAALESVVLPARGAACKTARAEPEFNSWRCPGPGGFGFEYNDAVMIGGLSFSLSGRALPPLKDDLTWAPAGSGIGSRIEWRMSNGKPFAAIIGRWRQADDSATAGPFEELLVVKVSEGGACRIATIGAFDRNAMSAARAIADERASVFRCGVDDAANRSDPSNASVGILDGLLGADEYLNHNGSLVALTHSPGGAIEIRYREPRQSLKIDPGTLLFEGSERNGRIEGQAFVFKAGCAPAGYKVTGTSNQGTLFLEGIAPRRDPRSCAVFGYDKASKQSRLEFEHEPVVEPKIPVFHAASETIANCSQCLSATIESLVGVGTAYAHVEARVTSDDVRLFCERGDDAPDAIDKCVKENAGEIGKALRAEANCKDLTVRPSGGGRFIFYKMGEDYGGPAPVWTNLANGEIECGARACKGPSASTHFDLLCPAIIPGWGGRRLSSK